MIFNADKSEILGVVSIIIVDKFSYKLRYYFQMKVSNQDVQNWLSIVEDEMISIIEQTNVTMIIEAVRLNFELPLDVKLNSQYKKDLPNQSALSHRNRSNSRIEKLTP